MEEIRTIQVAPAYGPLQNAFRYDLRAGYTALVGPNNAGKSSLLQLVFRTLYDDDEFGPARIAFIPADRPYVDVSIETGGRTLAVWNNDMIGYVRGTPVPSASEAGATRSQLLKLLLHSDLVAQVTHMNDLLPRFGLARLNLRGAGEVQFETIGVHVQGSGMRGLLPILAAVTNPEIVAILIDEPEMSLEPRLQKELRDLLVETAAQKRVVMVSTHSHLMLNRETLDSTQVVTRADNQTSIETVDSNEALFDITFDLLGSSTEDLFFPRNYLIVEGASDQVIAERVLELLGESTSVVKVLSAQGLSEVGPRAASVVRALVPLIVNDSPYAGRVVALIDAPLENEVSTVARLEKDLGERLFVLDEPSIEASLPSALYDRADRVKDSDLAEIERLRGDREARARFKAEVSNALASVMTLNDLAEIPVVKSAVERALES